jgi:prevent-host-death family protein
LIWTIQWSRFQRGVPQLIHSPASEAKAQLTDFVRRAEEGEEVVLTRHGRPVARLAAISAPISAEEHRRFIAAAPSAKADTSAARSQNFLYGDDGLPK